MSAVWVVSSNENIMPRFSSAVLTSDVPAGEVGESDIIETPVDPVDEDVQDEEVVVLSFDPREYKR